MTLILDEQFYREFKNRKGHYKRIEVEKLFEEIDECHRWIKQAHETSQEKDIAYMVLENDQETSQLFRCPAEALERASRLTKKFNNQRNDCVFTIKKITIKGKELT